MWAVDQLLERSKELLNNKNRIAIYSKNKFNLDLLEGLQFLSIYRS